MAEIIYNGNFDEGTIAQVEGLKDHPAFTGLISIMPDAHVGMGGPIGFTAKCYFDLEEKRGCVLPSTTGVDCGCGLIAFNTGLKATDITKENFETIDAGIREVIPLGFNYNKKLNPSYEYNLWELFDDCLGYKSLEYFGIEDQAPHFLNQVALCDFDKEVMAKFSGKGGMPIPSYQLGSLGGGNHFIELDKDEEDNLWLVIHTGSRHFGKKVADYFTAIAYGITEDLKLPYDKHTAPLPISAGGADYLYWLDIAQQYAQLNRHIIANRIINKLSQIFNKDLLKHPVSPNKGLVISVHNYINVKEKILRKGAISAKLGESVIIPLNMADGSIIGIGKGVSKYNYSAPHGAGRALSRKAATQRLSSGDYTMDNFREDMEGIYTTSISPDTIDEAPMAYKSWADIKEFVLETVEPVKVLKPVYNLKAEGD